MDSTVDDKERELKIIATMVYALQERGFLGKRSSSG